MLLEVVCEDMHMALFLVRDGFISAQVAPSRTRNKAICIFSHDITWLIIFYLIKTFHTQGAKPQFFGKPDMAFCKRLCDKNIIHGPSGVN